MTQTKIDASGNTNDTVNLTSTKPENTVVISTDIKIEETEDHSIIATLKQNQTSLAFAGAGIFSLVLVAARKKEEILQKIYDFKSKRESEKNIFS